MQALNVVLVGIGGYGNTYVDALRSASFQPWARIAGVVDPMAAHAPGWTDLHAAGVPQFDSLERFYTAGLDADLAIIASPIALHCEQACEALAQGAHVLCEKPVCATIQDARRMRAARDRVAGRFLAVGYQWSFSETIARLKADILAGRFGRPLAFRTRVAWPRGSAYYGRNRWAGRLRDGRKRWVLDSPVNNAAAHFLHNMLFLAGPAADRAAGPTRIAAELYRANEIENYDAACCRVETTEGVSMWFSAAHCVESSDGPAIRLEFELAVIAYTPQTDEFEARFKDGHVEGYGSPNAGGHERKLWICLEAARHGSLAVPCGVEAAAMHTLCVNGMQTAGVQSLDRTRLRRVDDGATGVVTYLPGLMEAMRRGFERGQLFSEMGMEWAAPARTLSLEKYRNFPRDGIPSA